MLVLTRRIGESLKIGEDILIHILGIKGNQIRIGIDAPKEVNVVRTELLPKLEKEGKQVYSDKEIAASKE